MKRICIIMAIVFFIGGIRSADAEMNRQETFRFLENAFNAQLALAEEYRTLEEVRELLSPYFTSSYLEQFVQENLFKDEKGYILLGSDVFVYFIPFFTYDQSTKVKKGKEEMIVYEFFPQSYEGPVIWDDHYEGVKLQKTTEGWKVSEYYLDGQAPELHVDEKERKTAKTG